MRWFLIISQAVYALLLPLWFASWLMLVMIFDAGIHFWAFLIYITFSAYPVAAIVCAIVSWLNIRRGEKRKAVYVNLIPALWIVAFGILYVSTLNTY